MELTSRVSLWLMREVLVSHLQNGENVNWLR